MLKLKGCPRCKGDVVVERDFDGWYEECLQCGYRHDLRIETPIPPELVARKRVKRLARRA